MILGLADGKFAEVEDRSRQYGGRMALADALHQMIQLADAAGGNDRYRDAVGYRLRQWNVKPLFGAVAIHRRQEDLAGAQRDHLLGIFEGVDPGGLATAMGKDLPAIRAAAALHPLGVDRHHDTLIAEFLRGFLDEFPPGD